MASRRTREPGLRLGRIAALVVAVVMIGLYVGPVQKYLRDSRELQAQRAQLRAVTRQHDVLVARNAFLGTKAGVMVLARKCGWTKPGETSFVIKNIASGCN
jgi:hypothetical protein